jgi:exopolyphosphatase/guanosine-5'-triphosphate,3'-diphosphate pyrophosphatase
MSSERRIGAIDAGSNALRAVVASATASGITVLDEQRAAVRLGSGTFTRGRIPTATVDEAIAAFARFRAMFDRHGVTDYRAVATSAVRDAENREVLLHRALHEAGVALQVIDGDEEARLVRKVTLHALARAHRDPTDDVACILDLGGGSLEVNLRRGPSWRGVSLPVGTVRLLETFGLYGALDASGAQIVRRYVATLVDGAVPAARRGLPVAAVTGGNADALAAICGIAPRDGGPSGPVPGEFTLADLEARLPELLAADVEARMERYAVRRDRAEVMAVAALIFATTARQLGVERFVVPGVGIRDALLLELAEVGAADGARRADASKALLTGARAFAHRLGHDEAHAEHVRRLARGLFIGLRPLHGLDDALLTTLELAALLHDVGEAVSPRGHHKHSEYLIEHAHLPGLPDEERRLVATIARAHRKDAAVATRAIADSSLGKAERGNARRLAALLRLADELDRSHRQTARGITCELTADALTLLVEVVDDGTGGATAAVPVTLGKADLFEQEFGMPVRCRARASRASGSMAAIALPAAAATAG